VVVEDEAMKRLYDLARRMAPSPYPVMILGETGAGKDVLARTIHQLSQHASGPMQALNCATVPETLIEAELFGVEKGAHSTAIKARPGLIEAAAGGTLFLDEVGDMPPALQVRLLRFLEDKKIRRLGSLEERTVNVRIIAATNKSLEAALAAGDFREDLFYRLRGLTLRIPPLRERPREVMALAQRFAADAAKELGRAVPLFSSDAVAAMRAHPWPGNVRQLRLAVQRAVLMCTTRTIEVADFGDELDPLPLRGSSPSAAPTAAGPPVPPPRADLSAEQRARRERLVDALNQAYWDQSGAATILGVSRGTVNAWMKELGVPRGKDRK
jgi:DNA-binding NtrC family response regulator